MKETRKFCVGDRVRCIKTTMEHNKGETGTITSIDDVWLRFNYNSYGERNTCYELVEPTFNIGDKVISSDGTIFTIGNKFMACTGIVDGNLYLTGEDDLKLYEEPPKDMTLEQVNKELGYKVKIIE